MKKLILLLYLTFYLFNTSFSQSCHLRISLLTCAPGEELYSTFGHTAIRVTDSVAGTDYVFNYGTFEFGPDFYVQFVRGKLLYYLSVENFNDFVAQYQWESRSIQEQVFALSCQERQNLYTALQANARPENRYYRYDFLFDNCTTRARDIVAQSSASPVLFRNILPKEVPTFRNLIHTYLNLGGQYWSKLGIDILLGAKLDNQVTNQQAMFLPDYLLKGFDKAAVNDSARVGKLPLVRPPQTILNMPSLLNKDSLFRPAIVFTVLLVLVLALSILKAKWSSGALQVFDFLFFFILGLAGILLLFMWFGTDHVVCRNNYNLLWALPTHVVMAFFVHSRKEWVSKYYKIVFWLTIVLTATWFFLPQEMNYALLPLVALILLRSWKLSAHRFRKAH